MALCINRLCSGLCVRSPMSIILAFVGRRQTCRRRLGTLILSIPVSKGLKSKTRFGPRLMKMASQLMRRTLATRTGVS